MAETEKTSEKNKIKVFFPIDNPDSDYTGEWMWAEALGGDAFLIENSPFNIYDISFNDIIEAIIIEGTLTYIKILKRGGHSTYRIRISDHDRYTNFMEGDWKILQNLGCSFESAEDNNIISLDVPPGVEVAKVYSILENGEANSEYEFEEAHYFQDVNSET